MAGGTVGLYQGWSVAHEVRAEHRWSVADLAAAMDGLPREIPATKDPGTIMVERLWASRRSQ